jgi:4-hydroxybenzoate polyprenyltransferase
MFYKIAQKIEEYGVPAMVVVVATVVTTFVGLFVITKGWALALIPPIGFWVIIQAWIDVKRDERKYMNLKAQREDENADQ